MAAFDYLALEQNGRQTRGVIEADSDRQVRQILRDKGLAPLKVDEASRDAKNKENKQWFSHSLSLSERALLTRQLATLVQAAIPLEEALTAAAEQTEKSRVKSLVLSVRSKVMEGHSLAQGMAAYPRAFPALFRATVAAGEQSGHLDLVLNRLADYTENSQVAWRKIKLAMLYPVLLLFMSLLIVTGLMVFVVPDVVAVFIDTGQELPALTRGLIAISDFISAYGVLTLVGLVLAIIGARLLLRRPALRLAWHRLLLRLPLVGRLSRGMNSARYASTLSILTTSGVPLVDAMRIATQVMSNEVLRAGVTDATQKVSEGSSLNRALQQVGYFPPMMIHMIASGEASGELDQMLDRVAHHQEQEVQGFVAVMVGLFEPFMLLFMGVMVLLIVMAILLPILNINQLVG